MTVGQKLAERERAAKEAEDANEIRQPQSEEGCLEAVWWVIKVVVAVVASLWVISNLFYFTIELSFV